MKDHDLFEELGRGSMGTVVRARHRGLDREVAIKIIAAPMDADALSRFHREVKVLSELAHPHIVRLYSSGVHNEQPYFMMELVKGHNLTRSLSEGPAAPVDGIRWMYEAADALAYIHGRQLTHRDVKPANLVVEDGGRLVLMDFGLVRDPRSTALTRAGALIGTPRYLAPEAIHEAGAAPPQDVYALGVTMFELFTGQRSFEAPDLQSLLSAILNGPSPWLDETLPGVPEAVCALQRAMVEKDPVRRPTAAQVRDVLEPFVNAGKQPIEKRVVAPARPRGPDSREKGPATRMVLFVGASAVMGLVALGLWQRRPSKPDLSSITRASSPSATVNSPTTPRLECPQECAARTTGLDREWARPKEGEPGRIARLVELSMTAPTDVIAPLLIEWIQFERSRRAREMEPGSKQAGPGWAPPLAAAPDLREVPGALGASVAMALGLSRGNLATEELPKLVDHPGWFAASTALFFLDPHSSEGTRRMLVAHGTTMTTDRLGHGAMGLARHPDRADARRIGPLAKALFKEISRALDTERFLGVREALLEENMVRLSQVMALIYAATGQPHPDLSSWLRAIEGKLTAAPSPSVSIARSRAFIDVVRAAGHGVISPISREAGVTVILVPADIPLVPTGVLVSPGDTLELRGTGVWAFRYRSTPVTRSDEPLTSPADGLTLRLTAWIHDQSVPVGRSFHSFVAKHRGELVLSPFFDHPLRTGNSLPFAMALGVARVEIKRRPPP